MIATETQTVTAPLTLAEAQAALTEVRDDLRAIADRLAALDAGKQAAIDAAGDAVLAGLRGGGESGSELDSLTRWEVEHQALISAQKRAKEREQAARRDVDVAEARDYRRQAADMREQADAHEARTKELMAAVEAHEGGAQYVSRRTHLIALSNAGAIVNDDLPPAPRSQIMREEADALEARATQADRRVQRFNVDARVARERADIERRSQGID